MRRPGSGAGGAATVSTSGPGLASGGGGPGPAGGAGGAGALGKGRGDRRPAAGSMRAVRRSAGRAGSRSHPPGPRGAPSGFATLGSCPREPVVFINERRPPPRRLVMESPPPSWRRVTGKPHPPRALSSGSPAPTRPPRLEAPPPAHALKTQPYCRSPRGFLQVVGPAAAPPLPTRPGDGAPISFPVFGVYAEVRVSSGHLGSFPTAVGVSGKGKRRPRRLLSPCRVFHTRL